MGLEFMRLWRDLVVNAEHIPKHIPTLPILPEPPFFIALSRFSHISPDLWQMFTTLCIFHCLPYCFWHCTAHISSTSLSLSAVSTETTSMYLVQKPARNTKWILMMLCALCVLFSNTFAITLMGDNLPNKCNCQLILEIYSQVDKQIS